MKKTMKKCLTLLLALAMLLAMAVPAVAEENYSREITCTWVAKGDTVKAYQLMKYDANYNEYIFDKGFEEAVGQLNSEKLPFEKYYANLSGDVLESLLLYYSAHMEGGSLEGMGNIALPDPYATETAGEEGTVAMTLKPGYYLFLVTTKAENSKIYQPVTAFVQVKNNKVYVSAAGVDITNKETVAFKYENGPVIAMAVLDDSRTEDGKVWRSVAAGSAGEEMDFYIHVKTPAYQGVASLTTLKVEDVLNGLEYVQGSVGVYGELSAITGDSAAIDGAVTAVADTYGNGTQNVAFNLDYSKVSDAQGAVSVYIHYKAVVKAEAAAKNAAASNSAVLKYATSLEPSTVKTTSDASTKVYTYAFSLAKKSDVHVNPEDSNSAFETLSGAEFTLYDIDKAAVINMIKVESEGEVYYRPAMKGESNTVTSMPADQGDGKNTLLVRGLDIGSYCVVESKTPSGYYAPAGDFKVELIDDRTTNKELNGELGTTSRFVELNKVDNLLINGIAQVNNEEHNRLDASLKNSSSPVLPTTGGVGTVMFTVIGLLCMGAALWFFLFVRRRREDEQEQNKTTL